MNIRANGSRCTPRDNAIENFSFEEEEGTLLEWQVQVFDQGVEVDEDSLDTLLDNSISIANSLTTLSAQANGVSDWLRPGDVTAPRGVRCTLRNDGFCTIEQDVEVCPNTEYFISVWGQDESSTLSTPTCYLVVRVDGNEFTTTFDSFGDTGSWFTNSFTTGTQTYAEIEIRPSCSPQASLNLGTGEFVFDSIRLNPVDPALTPQVVPTPLP